MRDIEQFHALAYDWQPDIPAEEIYRATEAGGYLLRTKIRGAIELLDQLYQYGEAGNIRVGQLTVRGKVILPSLGKDFFTPDGKQFFTRVGKQFFTSLGKQNF